MRQIHGKIERLDTVFRPFLISLETFSHKVVLGDGDAGVFNLGAHGDQLLHEVPCFEVEEGKAGSLIPLDLHLGIEGVVPG